MTQRVEEQAGSGERRDCLDQAWTPLLAALGMRAIPIPNRVDDVAAWVEEVGLDGVILTGGNDLSGLPGSARAAPERDACEHAILELAGASGLPVLGVCRGLQLMAQHHGATLMRVEGHVATAHALRISDPGPLALEPRDSVNSFHHFTVDPAALPPGVRVAATGADGVVEAIYHPRHRQAAVMWHPERGELDARDGSLLRTFFGVGA